MSRRFNDNMMKSLLCMTEEYDRLVSPLTKQLEIQENWERITSPLYRVAEMNQTALSAAMRYDMEFAKQLQILTKPYQPMLDNILETTKTIERLMNTGFSEYVSPQVYLPDIITSSLEEASRAVRAVKPLTGSHFSSVGIGTAVTGIADRLARPLKNWKIDLGFYDSLDLSGIPASGFGQLLKFEKRIAKMDTVIDRYDQITSISAQMASIQQIGLTDAWKNVIAPLSLFQELGNFALDQYTHIVRDTGELNLKWRFGLIDAVSKYVDSTVLWSADFAADTNGELPEDEISLPDFSEFPQMFGYAKRDNEDVEEAFGKSKFSTIVENGKLIIKKAKIINQYCKAINQKPIFAESELVNWAMSLASSYCCDIYELRDVARIFACMFNCNEVRDIISHHVCFETIAYAINTDENKKRKISSLQLKLYERILDAEDMLIDYFEEIAESVTVTMDEDTVSSGIYRALLNIQANHKYYGADENAINDAVRDQLRMVFNEVRDQTRQGVSQNGGEAGELDLLICDNGNPKAILEGMLLNGFNKTYFENHIKKTLINYDPIGLPLAYILIYVRVKDFDSFWEKLIEHMDGYDYPYEVTGKMTEIETSYTESRHARAVLMRNGKEISVHLYAIAIR